MPNLELTFETITEGHRFEHSYAVTASLHQQFLEAFQDHSPIHVDEAFARAQGFGGRVMHGAILHGFVSHFIGMVYPARAGMLIQSELSFQKPVYLEDRLRLSVKVSQKSEGSRVLVLALLFQNETQGCIAARGKAQVRIHAQR